MGALEPLPGVGLRPRAGLLSPAVATPGGGLGGSFERMQRIWRAGTSSPQALLRLPRARPRKSFRGAGRSLPPPPAPLGAHTRCRWRWWKCVRRCSCCRRAWGKLGPIVSAPAFVPARVRPPNPGPAPPRPAPSAAGAPTPPGPREAPPPTDWPAPAQPLPTRPGLQTLASFLRELGKIGRAHV